MSSQISSQFSSQNSSQNDSLWIGPLFFSRLATAWWSKIPVNQELWWRRSGILVQQKSCFHFPSETKINYKLTRGHDMTWCVRTAVVMEWQSAAETVFLRSSYTENLLIECQSLIVSLLPIPKGVTVTAEAQTTVLRLKIAIDTHLSCSTDAHNSQSAELAVRTQRPMGQKSHSFNVHRQHM